MTTNRAGWLQELHLTVFFALGLEVARPALLVEEVRLWAVGCVIFLRVPAYSGHAYSTRLLLARGSAELHQYHGYGNGIFLCGVEVWGSDNVVAAVMHNAFSFKHKMSFTI